MTAGGGGGGKRGREENIGGCGQVGTLGGGRAGGDVARRRRRSRDNGLGGRDRDLGQREARRRQGCGQRAAIPVATWSRAAKLGAANG